MGKLGVLTESVMGWANAALGLAYPEVCQLCHAARATPRQGYVCGDCRAQVRFIAPPFCEHCGRPFEGAITTAFECENCKQMHWHFRSARSAVEARDAVLEAIHRYKYNRQLWFEPFLADLFVPVAAPVIAAQAVDLIVPVPLYPTKQREREFNQAERLARRLSAATGIPLDRRLLRRLRPTLTQTALTRPERLENVRGAFIARRGRHLNGERVVLVDDVFTTGATTSACAAALKAAGAGDVCVWTLARGV